MKDRVNVPEIGDQVPRSGNRFTAWLGRSFLRLMGWRFEGNLPNQPKMVIAVAPHTTNWDFFIGLAALYAMRLKLSFLGKHTIFVPPIDRLLRHWGGIPVDRRSAHGVVASVAEQIKAKSNTILAIAPEGTRSPIYPWKTGFLQIANKAEVPVLLIGFDYDKKEIQFGPQIDMNEDIEKQMHTVYGFYATVHGKYPQNVVFPENKA